jgi:membrane glycosyltransferase
MTMEERPMSPGDTTPSAEGAERLDEFHAELARLRVKSSSRDDEQRLLFAGIVLMPLGLVLVLIGYIGASGTTEFSAQVPYLLSGGVLGLGVTVVGATLFLRYSLGRYLRFWLLRLIFEEHTTADRQVDALDRLSQQIAGSRDPQKET